MMINLVKRICLRVRFWFRMFLFDPIPLVNKLRALPIFVRNQFEYKRLNHDPSFRIRARDIYFTSYNRYSSAGTCTGDYFHQDIWAAKYLYECAVREHVDIGSRIDGFIGHILPFCRVTYVDLRPLVSEVDGLKFQEGSILELPFPDISISSLSCLHVIEHIGLGRYGDPVNPTGYLDAAKELTRVLKPGGRLILGTPVGKQRLCFDAHRVFAPQTILNAFGDLELVEFSLIEDSGLRVFRNASMDEASKCKYGCGLFVFKK